MTAAVADTSSGVEGLEIAFFRPVVQAGNQFVDGLPPHSLDRQGQRRADREDRAVILGEDRYRPVAVAAHGLELKNLLSIRMPGQAYMTLPKILAQIPQKSIHASLSSR